MQFKPVYQPYLWGGRDLVNKYARTDAPASGPVAESWEVSDRSDGMSVVASGPWAGRTLHELLAQHGEALLGKMSQPGHFPLLIKIIDAQKDLSIQVHPDDQTAAQGFGEAKSEAWYVLDAAPGACVYRGFLPGVTEADFDQALRDGTVDELMARQSVVPGDVIYIPGGTVHAIGAGCLLLEVQQNSNTTYRIFDWNRKDANGQPRELHIDQAKKVMMWETVEMHQPAEEGRCITPYFTIETLNVANRPLSIKDPLKGYTILFVEEGAVKIRSPEGDTLAEAGTTWLIPAAMKNVKALSGGVDSARVVLIRGVKA